MTKPLVTSLSMAFKRATTITEDHDEAKKEHRQNLKNLIDRYNEDVQKGKAEGIRTAKELVEVIKLDLLLMGEATERTDNTNPVDEAQIIKISQALDQNSPEVQSLIESIYMSLNQANDDLDDYQPVQLNAEPQREPTEEQEAIRQSMNEVNDNTEV